MTDRIDADRFDEELRRAARSLVTDELPRGVWDPAVGASLGRGGLDGVVRSRRALPGLASVVGAVAVLLLAIAVVFAPGSPGGPGPSATPSPVPSTTPVFRTSTEIRADFITLQYMCVAGQTVAPTATGPDVVTRESVVCTPPTKSSPPYMAAVIVGESADGRVVEVHAKGDLVGVDVPASRAALATLLAKAAAVVVPEGSGNAVGTWVESNLATLERGDAVETSIAGLRLEMGRGVTSGYTLRLTPLAPGG